VACKSQNCEASYELYTVHDGIANAFRAYAVLRRLVVMRRFTLRRLRHKAASATSGSYRSSSCRGK